jgi:DNA-binding CsgD family transcriptional regulator/PAS domain-containing protein
LADNDVLLRSLYAGLTIAPPWEGFLRALAEATGAAFATLLIGRGRLGIDAHVTPGLDAGRKNAYQRLSDADPFVGLPEGKVVSFQDFVHHVPMAFRDWMDISGTGQILGLDLSRTGDIAVRLRLTRHACQGDFAPEHSALVSALVPHLRIALDIHAQLATTQAESQVFESAISEFSLATLIVDRKGTILRRNAAAERLLATGRAITERGGLVHLRDSAAAAGFAGALAAPPPPDDALRLTLKMETGPSLEARVHAVPSSACGDQAWLALFVACPARAQHLSDEALRARFQFTRSEAALARLLAQGTALPEAARLQGMAYNTARSHLRGIFAKTGVHRQANLLGLLRSDTI